jgi:ribonuclease HII
LPKGPVIGPLVICGYLIKENKIQKLEKLKVRDSKELTPERRKKIVKLIKKMADDFIIIKLQASDIDKLRNEKNLNKIEIENFAKIIDLLSADIAIIDSPEVNTKKFVEKVKKHLKNKNVKIIAENYADKKYTIVSAASIIAKVTRDKEIEKIKKSIGYDFGTGYTHDERTIKFLKKLILEYKDYPDFVRKSWVTAKIIKRESKQKKLIDF